MFKKTIVFLFLSTPAYAQVDPATIAGMDAVAQFQYYQHEDAVGMDAAAMQETLDNDQMSWREAAMQEKINDLQEKVDQLERRREHDFIVNSLNH